MKFTDIEQFTRNARYTVDVPFIRVIKTLHEYISEMNLDMNPDFQRGHVWTEAQQIAYIEYVLKGGCSGRDIYFNAPFWYRRTSEGNYNDFVLVDGLQRLTAVSAFLQDQIRIFRDLDTKRHLGFVYSEFEDSLSMLLGFRFHVNDLQTRADVLKWYLEMNSGGTPHSAQELARVRALYEKEIV